MATRDRSFSPRSAQASHPSLISNLQVLRAVAAVIVIMLHTINLNPEYGFKSNVLPFFREWGRQGVDIFFVISGFVMVLTQHRKNRAVGGFIMDRIIRIVPIYWVLTIFATLLSLTIPAMVRRLHVDLPLLLHSLTFSTVYAQVHGPASSIPVLYVGWTLEYEMTFYAIFALCHFIPILKWRIIAQLAIFIVVTHRNILESVCFEFLFGEILALFYISGRLISEKAGVILCSTAVTLLLLPMALRQLDAAMLDNYRPLISGIPALALVAGSLYIKQVDPPILRLLGNASYSIYLLQVFSIAAVYKAAQILTPHLPGLLVALICIASACAAGVIFYLLVEKPLFVGGRYLLRQSTQRRAPVATSDPR